MLSDLAESPHRRRNPLTGDWTLVAQGRTQLPWSGQTEHAIAAEQPEYDPECYLCPGNPRAGGALNPVYDETFVFTNDFASLRPDAPVMSVGRHPLLRAETERGTCRVVCFSPRHDLTLASMGPAGIARTVDLWADQVAELAGEYAWVQVFENRGSEMGASNPHPHGQIWAGSALPTQAVLEDTHQLEYLEAIGRPLLVDYVGAESSDGTRIVAENPEWTVVVPFWAQWPYETMVLPKRPVERLPQLDPTQRGGLAKVLDDLLGRYDKLFSRPLPYSMGWHGAPGSDPQPHWQLHAHFYPPLLQATRRKFMVGYEMLAEAQRDLTPEDAAAQLSAVPAGAASDVG